MENAQTAVGSNLKKYKMKDELPIYSDESDLGDKGVRIVNEIMSDNFKWVFREQPKNDFGIDAHVEILNSSKKATGRLIALQIKCGNSFFEEETEEAYIFRGPLKHLNYWTTHSLPVVVTISKPDSKKTYWVEVTRSNTNVFKKGWKVNIPKNQLLTKDSKNNFQLIGAELQTKDMIDLLLYKFLYEKYKNRIRICPLLETPTDFHGLYLIRLDDNIEYAEFYYPYFNKYDKDAVIKILNKRDTNDSSSGNKDKLTKLNLFFVADSKDSLRIPTEILAIIEKYQNVEVFRLLYKNIQLFESFRNMDLIELDSSDKEIDIYWD